jgi:hypothetical protein
MTKGMKEAKITYPTTQVEKTNKLVKDTRDVH